jgi:hypothetical protein
MSITHKEGGEVWNSRFRDLYSRLDSDTKKRFKEYTFSQKKKMIISLEKKGFKFKEHVISGRRK